MTKEQEELAARLADLDETERRAVIERAERIARMYWEDNDDDAM